MKITEKEIESVSKLEPMKRYQYFIKRVADTEKMYTLVDEEDDWVISEVEGSAVFSLWSAPEFAGQCIFGEWRDCSVQEISLEYFEDEVIDEIETKNYLLNIFSVNGKSGFVVDINEFARDLSDEMKNY
ncbi:DUF2750 domain-containing protein [Arcticibacter sp. MXS-1]|uniref:DUF2750 domain-containing protein n=1 Tax=Arcticibacter sp. MXS-1 TaxID=3341726 RepID=UPI0035A8CD2A